MTILASPFALAQERTRTASLQGVIRDNKGNPLPQAVVFLEKKDSSEKIEVKADSLGRYTFAKVPAGLYSLRAIQSGFLDVELDAVFLKPDESKTIDLTLGTRPSKESTTTTPQFYDQPQFTVSGVTDTTNLGGHGSDSVVRTRDSLAKETISLNGATPKPPADSAANAANYSAAKSVEKELATHETADLHHRLADVEEKMGDSLEAVRHYQRAAELEPTEPHLFDWGAELLLHHAPEPAAEVFSKGSEKYPNSARMLLGLGAASFARGNIDEAIRRICQASDISPDYEAPYLFLGKIEQSEITAPDDLLEKLHRFVTLQPHNADANYYYAVALWKDRNRSQRPDTVAQVESLLKSALQIDPKYAPAELQMGIVHADQHAYSEAIPNYQKALEVDPNLEEAHYRLAQAYRETGQSEKAKEEIRLYGELAKASALKQDRERHEIKQFVYTLRDQPAPQSR